MRRCWLTSNFADGRAAPARSKIWRWAGRHRAGVAEARQVVGGAGHGELREVWRQPLDGDEATFDVQLCAHRAGMHDGRTTQRELRRYCWTALTAEHRKRRCARTKLRWSTAPNVIRRLLFTGSSRLPGGESSHDRRRSGTADCGDGCRSRGACAPPSPRPLSRCSEPCGMLH
jgi:hypothetical protein